jgi:hypothetical protein
MTCTHYQSLANRILIIKYEPVGGLVPNGTRPPTGLYAIPVIYYRYIQIQV